MRRSSVSISCATASSSGRDSESTAKRVTPRTLGLREQLADDVLAVRSVVRDDQHLRRPGQSVDTAPPEDLPLGLGRPDSAASDDLFDATRTESRAERRGGDRLRRRRSRRARRRRTARTRRAPSAKSRIAGRRREHDDARNAGDLRRHRAHQDRHAGLLRCA